MNNCQKIEEFKRQTKVWLKKWGVPERFIEKIGDSRSGYKMLSEGPNEVRIEYLVPPPGIGTNDETFSLRANVKEESKKAATLIGRIAKRNKHI